MPVTFTPGLNIAMKIPLARYEDTVRFYRDVLGCEVAEVDDTGAATVTRSHSVSYGPVTLWLDQVDTYPQADVWLQVVTDDLDGAATHLAAAGIPTCDELEPLNPGGRGHWIRNPAGVVHLLAEGAGAT